MEGYLTSTSMIGSGNPRIHPDGNLKKATVPGKGFDEFHQIWQCWKKFHAKYVVHCRSHYSQEFLSIQYITIYSYIYIYLYFFIVILITVYRCVANASHFSDAV